MRSLQAAVVTACVVLLAGCDDTPSNSMTDAQNKKVAETEAWVPSIKVVDFVRENAWYDCHQKLFSTALYGQICSWSRYE